MNNIGQAERITQNRVIALLRDELKYTYLGNRKDRPNNSNIEEELLTKYLVGAGYSATQISEKLYMLCGSKQTTLIAVCMTTTMPCTKCCAMAYRLKLKQEKISSNPKAIN